MTAFVAKRLGLALFVVLLSLPASAQSGASAVIDRLNATLTQVMQNARQLGFQGRYAALSPVLQSTFDFPTMAQIVVGPQYWQSFSQAQKAQLVDAFTRMSISNFASKFNDWSGEQLEVVSEQPSGRGNVLVRTRIVRPTKGPVNINYVMRQSGGRWRVVDVFLNGVVSELSSRRAEYTAVLGRSGFPGLIAEIEALIQRLRVA